MENEAKQQVEDLVEEARTREVSLQSPLTPQKHDTKVRPHFFFTCLVGRLSL